LSFSDFPLFDELRNFVNIELPELLNMPKDEKVFKKYNVERIGKTFRKILNETGLKDESYNLKTFRKTFATRLADEGISEGDLADLLGHTSISTTRQYYKKKNAGAIRKRIDAIDGLKIC